MGSSNSEYVSTRQKRIAELAKQMPHAGIRSLNHYLDMTWLHEAFRLTRKTSAPGVDGQTAAAYAEELERNLTDLIDRAKSGLYKAPPVKRGYVPKDERSQRPIGMPTFEDKVLQRAVVMALTPIYEQDFYDCSYGFRPGRSPHQALEALWQAIMSRGGCWIIDADIQSFFDSVDRVQAQEFLRKRVDDRVIRRLVGKWLRAGVMEDGQLYYPEAGTPQGGVISPLLSNIYLHEVLDSWFAQEVQPRMHGSTFMFRFADDFVLGFTSEADARRVMDVLPKRFARFGLTIHPEKTRLVDFCRPTHGGTGATFDFLGFRHYWGTSRKGRPLVQRKTLAKRLRRSLRAISGYCRKHRHHPLPSQQRALATRLRGHYHYYGITGNYRSLDKFYRCVCRIWKMWLDRRSRKRDLIWDRFQRLLRKHALPLPRVVRSVLRATGQAAT